MNLRRLLTISFALGTMTSALPARVSLAPLFSDHLVLQRDKPVPVWGHASPGETITVKFGAQTVGATATADGRWIVYLEPLLTSSEPAELVVTGKNTVTVRDVLVGEVWLASGQSNMEWPLSLAREASHEIAAADFPTIRQLKIERTVATAPVDTVKTSGWVPASPETAGDFSAVGYFFARHLSRKLGGVPVGIIDSSWGGTTIEAWMSDAARHSTSIASVLDARWQQARSEWPPERVARYPADMEAWQKAEAEAKAKQTKNLLPWPQPPASLDSPALPGGLYNGMIAPLQPGALRGILWYQGESNADRADEYPELFSTLIRTWRSHWGDAGLPFYFVQIPNYADGEPNGRKWARLREAQAAALALPATAMAVTIDVGDAQNLHPPDKEPVGRRLALIAEAKTYGLSVDYSGPQFAGATREGRAMRVRFAHGVAGLVAHNRPVQSLEIAGADRTFYPATARIEGDTLLVSAPEVAEPVAVRYAWTNAPIANLYDGTGLPAAPFRSDSW